MEQYLRDIREHGKERYEAGIAATSRTYDGSEEFFEAAIYGNLDAVKKYRDCKFTNTYTRLTQHDLQKLYKGIAKNYEKTKKSKIKLLKDIRKCFSDKELGTPRADYLVGVASRERGDISSWSLCNNFAAKGGDPDAILDMLEYYSTNGQLHDLDGRQLPYQGKFHWEGFFEYVCFGLAFELSPYYPSETMQYPAMDYDFSVLRVRRGAYQILLETMACLIDPAEFGTARFRERFGDFVPDETQVKIARNWFFTDDSKIRPLKEQKEMRDANCARIRRLLGIAETSPMPSGGLDLSGAINLDAPAPTPTPAPAPAATSTATNSILDAALDLSAPTSAPTAPARPTPKKGNTTVKSILYENGASYHGEVVNNAPHGTGKYTYSGGDTYEGDFDNGKKTGRGKYTSTGGWWYEGDFVNGNFNGHGVYHYKSGDTYEGDFVDDKRTGKGIYTSVKGWRYEGDFVNGNFNGHGVYYYSSGDRYEGDFVEDQKTGHGTYFFQNGDIYEGEFVNGNFHGSGRYTFASGNYFTGTWENDKNVTRSDTMSGTPRNTASAAPTRPTASASQTVSGAATVGRQNYNDGSYYEGDLVNGTRHGKGTYHWANGDFYEGEWRNGKRNGYGVVKTFKKISLTGQVEVDLMYEGYWQDNKKHGKGKYSRYNHDHVGSYSLEEGEWVNGDKEGRFLYYNMFPRSTKRSTPYLNYYRRGYLVYNVLPYDPDVETYSDFVEHAWRERCEDASKLTCSYYPLMKPVKFCIDESLIQYIDRDDEGSGWGAYVGTDGFRYIGTYKYGLADGFGQCEFADGAWYTGEFKLGKLYGRGVYFDGRDYHFGDFENNLCTTERRFVSDLGPHPEKISNGAITLYMANGMNLMYSDIGIGFSQKLDEGGFAYFYHIQDGRLSVGRTPEEIGAVCDEDGYLMIVSHGDPEKAFSIRGKLVDGCATGKGTCRYIHGSVIETDVVDGKIVSLSHRNWRGEDE